MIVVLFFSVLLFIDTLNFVEHIDGLKQKQVLMDLDWVPEFNSSSYQAILPIPFYHVGSENYDYTLDPDDHFCTKSYQLSMATGLPLIASKLSRTSEQQAISHFNIFLDPAQSSLQEMEKGIPLLIMSHRGELDQLLNNPAFDKSKPIWRSLKLQKELLDSGVLKELERHKNKIFYSWSPFS